MAVIPAAGTLPWRITDGVLRVAMVHRPKYRDWSWAKGKIDSGELAPVAAGRETFEETGLHVRLGIPLPCTSYTVLDRTGLPATKQVQYWASQVTGGEGLLVNEIDAVDWLTVPEAVTRLDYAHDRDQLRALVQAEARGELDTWPLAIVRHGRARPRTRWKANDQLRPLYPRGAAQAAALVPLLWSYAIVRVVTSESVRCVQTMAPYAEAAGLPLRLRAALSEESFRRHPDAVEREMARIVAKGRATAVCGHGPVLPTMFGALLPHTSDATRSSITRAIDRNLAKGETVVCHIAGRGATARVVAVERHKV